MEERRWIIVALGIAGGVALFAGGLLLGALVAGSSDDEAASPTTTTTPLNEGSSTTTSIDPTGATLAGELAANPELIESYGSPVDRAEFVEVMRNSGLAVGTEEELLATADEICYHLERLRAQNRHAAYAVRIVWNEALSPLESAELAAFGTVFVAAPHFLCPESAEYAEEVSYWLGY